MPGTLHAVVTRNAEKTVGEAYVDAAVNVVVTKALAITGGSLSPASGHVLVFLAGEEQILRAVRLTRQCLSGRRAVQVYPLFASLPKQEQERAIEPPTESLVGATPTRKVVYAITLAETSFTIAGVTEVVDCCRAKVERLSSATCVNALFVRHIYRYQAEHKKGSGRSNGTRNIRPLNHTDRVRESVRAHLRAGVAERLERGRSIPRSAGFFRA